ncbi:MAG: hypothetical protein ACRC8S_20085 [Fimbriiglobus sp.]
MLSRMMQTINRSDNLYLSPKEQKEILQYARSIPGRFAAVRALQAEEVRIVSRALAALGESEYLAVSLEAQGWTSAVDDLKLILRTIALAVLTEDEQVLETRVLSHLRRKLRYLDFPHDATYSLFLSLISFTETQLAAEHCEIITPYFEPLLTTMTPGYTPEENEE